MNCRHCNNEKTLKNGTSNGTQRHICNTCGRTFSANTPKFSEEIKRQAY